MGRPMWYKLRDNVPLRMSAHYCICRLFYEIKYKTFCLKNLGVNLHFLLYIIIRTFFKDEKHNICNNKRRNLYRKILDRPGLRPSHLGLSVWSYQQSKGDDLGFQFSSSDKILFISGHKGITLALYFDMHTIISLINLSKIENQNPPAPSAAAHVQRYIANFMLETDRTYQYFKGTVTRLPCFPIDIVLKGLLIYLK